MDLRTSRHRDLDDEAPTPSTSRQRRNPRRRTVTDTGGTLQLVDNEEEQEEDEDEDEYDEEEDGSGSGKRRRTSRGKTTIRRAINISHIADRSRRNITFNKRKTGILKKAHELATLTGADVLLLIASRDTEQVYTYTTPNMGPLTNDEAGRNNIQNCLRFGTMSAPLQPLGNVQPLPALSQSPIPSNHQQLQRGPSPPERVAGPSGPSYPTGSQRPALSLAMPVPGYDPSAPHVDYPPRYTSPSIIGHPPMYPGPVPSSSPAMAAAEVQRHQHDPRNVPGQVFQPPLTRSRAAMPSSNANAVAGGSGYGPFGSNYTSQQIAHGRHGGGGPASVASTEQSRRGSQGSLPPALANGSPSGSRHEVRLGSVGPGSNAQAVAFGLHGAAAVVGAAQEEDDRDEDAEGEDDDEGAEDGEGSEDELDEGSPYIDEGASE